MRISDWSSDVCSSDLGRVAAALSRPAADARPARPAAASRRLEDPGAGLWRAREPDPAPPRRPGEGPGTGWRRPAESGRTASARGHTGSRMAPRHTLVHSPGPRLREAGRPATPTAAVSV